MQKMMWTALISLSITYSLADQAKVIVPKPDTTKVVPKPVVKPIPKDTVKAKPVKLKTTATIVYDTGTTKSGYKTLRFKLPYFSDKKDTTYWIAFGPDAIAEFVKNDSAVKNLDNQMSNSKHNDSQYVENDKYYKNIIKISVDNETTMRNLLIDMKKYNDELYGKLIKTEGQKWSWGFKGLLVGAAAASLATFVIIEQAK